MPIRKLVLSLLQISLSILLGYIVFSAVDWPSMFSLAKGADLKMLFLSAVLVLLIRLAVAIRWQISLQVLGINVGIAKLLEHIFVSHSFGYLTPGGVGSDILRAYKVYSKEKQLLKISSTLVLERVLGVLSLIVVASAAMLLVPASIVTEIPFFRIVITIFALAMGAGAFACVLLLSKTLREFVGTSIARLPRVKTRLSALFVEIRGIGDAMVKASVVSIIIQLLRCLTFLFLFAAFGSPVEIVRLGVVIPIVFLLMLLPISVGGIGVREGVLAVYSDFLGIPQEQAVLAGLGFYFLQLLMLVPGFAIAIVTAVRLKR